MKKVFITILVLLLSITVLGCNNAAEPTTATTGNEEPALSAEGARTDTPEQAELIIAGQEIAASLDPVQPLTSSYLRGVGAAEALFRVGADGSIEPSLAAGAHEVDETTWEIKLRSDVRFWSGKPVDAGAVIASLERSKAEDPQAQPFLNDMTFAEQGDDTIQVKTGSAHLPVPLNLSYYQTVIHNAEAKHDAVDTMDLTGMYKVVLFEPKQKMVLEINEHYWGEKPQIKRVVHEEISDGQTRVLSVLSGRSHIALNVPVTSLEQFKASTDAVLSAAPVANTQTVYINLDRPQFKDVRVRQALSWAVDREELVIVAAEGQSIPVTTWLGSNPAFAEAKSAVYSSRADQAKAGQLLDEAGWAAGSDGIRYKEGAPLTLRLMTWGGDKALGEALQNQWTKLGVKVEVQHGDYSLIQAARDKGDWDASIEAWSTFGDTFTLLRGQFSPEGSANYGGYNDEETNRLLAQLKETADAGERHKLALRINERVAQQAPVIALFPRPQITAVSTKLTGFEQHFRQFEHIVNAHLRLGSADSK